MRVLIVTGYLGGSTHNPWLIDDLAVALADAGDDVDVLVHDTKHARPSGRNDYPDKRIRVFSVGPTKIRLGRLGKLANHGAAALGLHTLGFQLTRRYRYDLCIYTSIGLFSWGLPTRLRRRGIVRRSVFVLWDFFPIHQVQIGRIAIGLLQAPLRAAEALSMKGADAIAVMSPANERFLRTYHPHARTRAIIVPPWASATYHAALTPGRQRFAVIFGGQLAAGRGVETLLRAAKKLQDDMVPMDLLIVGDGPARKNLIAQAAQIGLTNAEFFESLPRDAYRDLLGSAHVGVAITVPGVTTPTFPSKIVEYCAMGIPVIVCVEAASDTGTIIETAGAGLAVPAGDEVGLAAALAALHKEYLDGSLEARGRKARALFESELSVTLAAEKLRAVGATP